MAQDRGQRAKTALAARSALLSSISAVAFGFLAALSLSGCDQKKQTNPPPAATNNAALAMPLTTGPVTTPAAAPPAAALPAAAPVRVVRVQNPDESYAYVDRASATSDAIGEAPPDYGFDYQGVRPWVWHTANQSITFAEPLDYGYRYYYYQPGADTPYLVRDAQYSYGYSNGELVVVYDNDGRLLPPDEIYHRADFAGRYLARAEALYQASLQSERQSINAANWAARRAEIDASRTQWEAQQSRQDAWRAYHEEHAAEEQAYWQGERAERQRAARSFDDWSRGGYTGAPPPPAYNGDRGNAMASSNPQAPPQQARPPMSTPRTNSLPQNVGNAPAGPTTAQSQQEAIAQARKQQAQADADRQSQAKAQQAALAQARQQQSQADSVRQAQAAAQAREQRDAIAHARRQQSQTDAAQQAKIQAQKDAAALAQKQQADAIAKQQADARARQIQAQADAKQVQAQKDALALAQKQQADAAVKQQADARARQIQAQADAAKQVQAQKDAAALAQKQQAEIAARQQAQAAAAQQAKAQARTTALEHAKQEQARTAAEAAAQAQRHKDLPATGHPSGTSTAASPAPAPPPNRQGQPSTTEASPGLDGKRPDADAQHPDRRRDNAPAPLQQP